MRLVNSVSLDVACTHLVIGQVAKTEKLLAAVAKGNVWILDRYIEHTYKLKTQCVNNIFFACVVNFWKRPRPKVEGSLSTTSEENHSKTPHS